MDQVGLLIVVAQGYASNDGRLEANAARIAADGGEPWCRNIGPTDRDTRSDLLHER